MWVVQGSGGDRSRAPDVRVLFALPSSQAGPETSFVLLRAPLSPVMWAGSVGTWEEVGENFILWTPVVVRILGVHCGPELMPHPRWCLHGSVS